MMHRHERKVSSGQRTYNGRKFDNGTKRFGTVRKSAPRVREPTFTNGDDADDYYDFVPYAASKVHTNGSEYEYDYGNEDPEYAYERVEEACELEKEVAAVEAARVALEEAVERITREHACRVIQACWRRATVWNQRLERE
jgi:hypothetical protein